MGRLKTSDLVRTLLSFNGISNGKRSVRVRSVHDGGSHSSSYRLTMEEKGDKLFINLPELPIGCSDEDIERVRRAVYERVASFLNSDGMQADLQERALVNPEKPSPLGMITEAFEGMRASHEFGKDWAGARSGVAGQQANRLDVLKSTASEVTQEGAGYAACETLASELLSSWSPDLVSKQSGIEQSASPELSDAIEKLRDSGIIEELRKAKSYEDSKELANRAFEMLYEKSAEEEEQQCQAEAQQQGDGDQQGEGEGEGQQGSGGEETKGMAQAMAEKGADRGRGDQQSDSKGDGSKGQKSEDPSDGDPDHWAIGQDGTGNYIPTPDDQVEVMDYSNPSFREGRVRRRANLHSSSTGLANSVRRAIQVRSQAHYIGAQKKGKLQRKNLYRAACPTVGDGEWNSRIRRQRQQAQTLDTAVMLLVDYSGSMNGNNKLETAMGSAIALADVLSSLNIPFAIQGFTERETHIQLVFKHFTTPYNRKSVVESMELATAFTGGNEDYKAIDLATRELEAQRNRRKLMITLSDGHPACCRPGNQEEAIVDFIRDHSHIVEYVGIGIQDDAVRHLYPSHEVLRNVNELGDAILSTIKSKIV